MKKVVLQIALMTSLSIAGVAQSLYLPGGASAIKGNTNATNNVGIDVANPTEKLSVEGNVSVPFKNWYGVSPSGHKFLYKGENVGEYALGWLYDSWNTSPSSYWSSYGGVKIFTAQQPRVVVSNGGLVGIGTETPNQRLDVNGNVQIPLNNSFAFGLSDTFSYDGKRWGNYSLSWVTDSWSGSPTAYLSSYGGVKIFASGQPRLVVHESGNVAIGTTDSKGYRLAVGGKVIAEEVVVKLAANWPDYVFTPSYDLRPLSDVRSFINQHGHLPEVPAAAEVEENGIALAAMNATLLKKVEELTLYILEQEERMAKQDERLKKLEAATQK